MRSEQDIQTSVQAALEICELLAKEDPATALQALEIAEAYVREKTPILQPVIRCNQPAGAGVYPGIGRGAVFDFPPADGPKKLFDLVGKVIAIAHPQRESHVVMRMAKIALYGAVNYMAAMVPMVEELVGEPAGPAQTGPDNFRAPAGMRRTGPVKMGPAPAKARKRS